MDQRREVVSSQEVFQGALLEVLVEEIRLPGGTTSRREIVRHPGAAGIVAVIDGRFLLVRQNRHAVGKDLLEIPAGKLDPGETPEVCAGRELMEETGYRPGSLLHLTTFLPTPGYSNEEIHIYMTTDARAHTEPLPSDEGEPISIEWLPLPEAPEAVRDGRIVDSKTIIGITMAMSELSRHSEHPHRRDC